MIQHTTYKNITLVNTIDQDIKGKPLVCHRLDSLSRALAASRWLDAVQHAERKLRVIWGLGG
jgi:hypothetical protein